MRLSEGGKKKTSRYPINVNSLLTTTLLCTTAVHVNALMEMVYQENINNGVFS